MLPTFSVCDSSLPSLHVSPPRKRLGMHTSCELTQGVSTESPLPLWERDRVRGPAPAGADGAAAGSRTGNLDVACQFPHFRVSPLNEVSSRCRASPLALSLSHKGRGDSVSRPCVIANLCAYGSAKAGVQGRRSSGSTRGSGRPGFPLARE